MISKEEIQGLSELARLELSDEEVASLQKDVSDILDYVAQINTFEGSEKKNEMPLLRNVLREDVPRAPNDALARKEESVRNAFPKREGDFNVVRKIIQKDE